MNVHTPLTLLSIAIISACGVNHQQSELPSPSTQKSIDVATTRDYQSDMMYIMPVTADTVSAEKPRLTTIENYANTDISPIKIVADEPVSTFSSDVDTASYTNSRRYLEQGMLPPTDAIRVEEFINYFDYGLNTPTDIKTPLALETEVSQTPWNKNTQLMRVSLQAYKSNMADLPPLNLVFLLDVSGSMSNPDKLPLMQRSFNLLAEQLRPQDRVAIAVYAGDSGVVLEPTAGNEKTLIINAINQLRSGGATHGSAGIELAYELAEANFDNASINRVIIGTDGDFNVGTVGIDALKDLIETKRNSGIFLSVLGFGTGNYNDYLMEELSNHGNGIAYYIDNYQEARKIFSEQLTATLQTVAKDVKIQIEFNPELVAEYRLIGYDNRELEREDFNNDKVDAGEMGSGHSVTALYEIVPTQSAFRFNDPLRYEQTNSDTTLPIASTELAFMKVRYKLPDSNQSNLITTAIHQTSQVSSEKMEFISGVAAFAEQLRHSPYIEHLTDDDLIALITAGKNNDRWGYRQQLLQLVKNAQSLEGY